MVSVLKNIAVKLNIGKLLALQGFLLDKMPSRVKVIIDTLNLQGFRYLLRYHPGGSSMASIKKPKAIERLVDKVVKEMRTAQEKFNDQVSSLVNKAEAELKVEDTVKKVMGQIETLQKKQLETIGHWQKEVEDRVQQVLDFQKHMMETLMPGSSKSAPKTAAKKPAAKKPAARKPAARKPAAKKPAAAKPAAAKAAAAKTTAAKPAATKAAAAKKPAARKPAVKKATAARKPAAAKPAAAKPAAPAAPAAPSSDKPTE